MLLKYFLPSPLQNGLKTPLGTVNLYIKSFMKDLIHKLIIPYK